MPRNRIRQIVFHEPAEGIHALPDKVSEFHVDIIERRLNQSDLSTEQKIAVVDKILDALKSREVDGVIK